MTPDVVTILIAENEILIALEAERILSEAMICHSTIINLEYLPQALSENQFDLVVIDASPVERLNAERCEQIMAAGAKPIFLSAFDHPLLTDTILVRHPTISKPILPEQIVAVVRSQICKMASDGEGLFNDR